jgi:AbrB family looped-hinge helix DNA binding protein
MKLTKAEDKLVDFGLDRAFLELRGIVRDPAKLADVRADTINVGKRKTYFVKMTAGGRVTIPAPIRKELGIDGEFVHLYREGDTIVIEMIRTLNKWYHAYFGKNVLKPETTWEAAEKALARAGPKIMDELYGLKDGEEESLGGGWKPSREWMRKEIIRCPCGRRMRPRMFRIQGFDIRGSECPKCGEASLNSGDANRQLQFNKLRHWVLKKIDPDYGLELSAETKKDLARSRADIGAGRVYTLDEVEKRLKLARRRE